MRYIYSLLIYSMAPLIFLRLFLRSRKAPEYRRRWSERLGFTPHCLENCIWVHAVSVGETIAALPLVKELRATYPSTPILVTNMTPTGAARVKAAFGDSVLQCYIPYDFPDAVNRFLKRVKPQVAIIMETELWPNTFAACRKRNVPLVVTNARLSEKSARGYKVIHFLTQEMLSAVRALSSQGYADAERFIQLGMPKERVQVTGNLKFDLQVPAELKEKSIILKNQLGLERLIWVAASTHPTEEEKILEAHKIVREKFSNTLLILVPRHPNRFDSVADLIRQKGFSVQRRTEANKGSADVYLADTMGELLLMYATCDVAFVAGSFASVGGHNMLEAAALGKPILTGPQLFNFAEISEMLILAEAMTVVNDSNELAEEIIALFADPAYRATMGANALQVVEQNRGALVKQMEVIKSFMLA